MAGPWCEFNLVTAEELQTSNAWGACDIVALPRSQSFWRSLSPDKSPGDILQTALG